MTWAVDLNSGGAALLIALLVEREQRLLYITGRTVNRAAGGYRGEGKTDARDAGTCNRCDRATRSPWTCGS